MSEEKNQRHAQRSLGSLRKCHWCVWNASSRGRENVQEKRSSIVCQKNDVLPEKIGQWLINTAKGKTVLQGGGGEIYALKKILAAAAEGGGEGNSACAGGRRIRLGGGDV